MLGRPTSPLPVYIRGANLTLFRPVVVIRTDRIGSLILDSVRDIIEEVTHTSDANFPMISTSINQKGGCVLKAEKLKKEREEGKPEKKKRRNVRRKPMGPTNSAGEAIEKILQEKKISSKINYDVLKSLNASINKTDTAQEEEAATSPSLPTKRPRLQTDDNTGKKDAKPSIKILGRSKKSDVGLPFVEEEKKTEKKDEPSEEEELDEDYEEEDNVAEESVKENGLLEMLRQHREDGDEGEEYFGYDEEEY
ncbi:hypothetical protein MTP99_002197 [Tenebrio molitor]|nr:hypothetical protein MTP99_002197 [Tenebrio molitor]